MRTLYISDLDGTLLNKNAELSSCSIETINTLMKKGMHFSIATARSAASAVPILKDLQLSLPIILMNGVLVFDLKSKRYLNIEYLAPTSLAILYRILKKYHLNGFLYEVKDHMLSTYYERLSNKSQQDFYTERVNKYHKVFTQVNDFSSLEPKNLIYLSLLDKRERLEGAYQLLKDQKDFALAYYKDVYSQEDMWYLEIFSAHATKYNAVQYLKKEYHFDRIIGFGDNLNDLPLFRACDITCAVANANNELKTAADYIIGTNMEDGVADWLRRNYHD